MKNNLPKLFFITGAALAASCSQACSICIAHAIGAGLQAVGAQILHKDNIVFGFSYTSFTKSQDGETLGSKEKHDHSQVSLDIMKGLNDQWMLRASLPYVSKRLSVTGDSPIDTKGLGDISIGATYQVKPTPSDKVLFATMFDLKLATGRNSLTDGLGSRLEEHSQLGTGSKDFSFGVLATTQDRNQNLWFAGLTERLNGRNGTGYHYGNTTFYDFGVSKEIDPDSSFVIELNGRLAARDRTDIGDLDPDSGGHLGYVSLSYRRNLGFNTGLIASYQIPFIRQLNGSQTESGLLTIGIYSRR